MLRKYANRGEESVLALLHFLLDLIVLFSCLQTKAAFAAHLNSEQVSRWGTH